MNALKTIGTIGGILFLGVAMIPVLEIAWAKWGWE
jgi:hypothetical protein